jgi:hypothetical protein
MIMPHGEYLRDYIVMVDRRKPLSRTPRRRVAPLSTNARKITLVAGSSPALRKRVAQQVEQLSESFRFLLWNLSSFQRRMQAGLHQIIAGSNPARVSRLV